jgi:hypothetical protein
MDLVKSSVQFQQFFHNFEHMENLADTCNELLQYLQQGIPETAYKFLPGISRESIQSALGTLDSELPEDFYELYEWRNGYADFNGNPNFNLQNFAPFHFNTIEMLVLEKDWEWCDDNPPSYKESGALPLVSCGQVFWGILLGRSYQSEAHIVYVDTVGECTLRYDSITSMINTLACSFRAGALCFGNEGSVELNSLLFSEVLRKNNSKVLSEALIDFEENLEAYGSDDYFDEAMYSDKVSCLLDSLSSLYFMKPPHVVEQVHNKLMNLENLLSPRAVSAREGLRKWLSFSN